MGRGVNIPWVGGQNTMGRGVNIPWKGVKIPWVWESKYCSAPGVELLTSEL
jgi:hypothetical protein